jgi:hypothetical protein
MASELRESIGDKERVGKSRTTERSRRKRKRLNDNRSDGKKIRVRVESKWNSAKLRGERHPSNSSIRKEEMTAGASSRRRSDAGIGIRDAGQRTEANRKIGQQSMRWVRSNSTSRWRSKRHQSRGARGRGGSDKRRNMGDAFQRIVRIKHSRLVGCGPSSAIVEI